MVSGAFMTTNFWTRVMKTLESPYDMQGTTRFVNVPIEPKYAYSPSSCALECVLTTEALLLGAARTEGGGLRVPAHLRV